MESQGILKLIQFNQYNLSGVLSYILLYLAILWLLFCLWVLKDITSRTKNTFGVVFAVGFVLIFNIPGLLIYLMLRPEKTIDEAQALDLHQISQLDDNLTTCVECRSIMKRHLSYCTVCGHKLLNFCEYCGKEVNPVWNICGFCGQSLYATMQENYKYRFNRLILRANVLRIALGYRLSAIKSKLVYVLLAPKRLASRFKVESKAQQMLLSAPAEQPDLALAKSTIAGTNQMEKTLHSSAALELIKKKAFKVNTVFAHLELSL